MPWYVVRLIFFLLNQRLLSERIPVRHPCSNKQLNQKPFQKYQTARQERLLLVEISTNKAVPSCTNLLTVFDVRSLANWCYLKKPPVSVFHLCLTAIMKYFVVVPKLAHGLFSLGFVVFCFAWLDDDDICACGVFT